MKDEANVRLVDTHAEGDGGDDYRARLGHEGVLVTVSVEVIHAGVVGKSRNALGTKQGGGLFGFLAR